MADTHATAGEGAEPRRSPRWRKGLARAAVLLGSFVVAFLVVEIAVRVLGPHVPSRGEDSAKRVVRNVSATDVEGVRFMLVPGVVRQRTYPGVPGGPARTVTYAINEHGFRGAPVPRGKPEGTYRVVVLGDSFTYGVGVDQNETWPRAMERAFAELDPTRNIQVLNWGVPAYNTRQEVALLSHWLEDFGPDLILLCAYVNDASGEDRGRRKKKEDPPWEVRWVQRLGLTSGRWSDQAPKTDAQRRMMALRERSRLIDLFAFRANGWLSGRVAARNYVEDWSEGSPGLVMVRSALAVGAVRARRHGVPFHATMYPELSGSLESYAFAEQHAIFRVACEKVGIRFHDVVPAFEGKDTSRLRAHAHDRHPNGAAHELAGRYLAEVLLPFTR